MNGQLYTYSLIRTLYDTGADYIDCFWPFVLTVLPSDQSPLPLDALQTAIKERYDLTIPQHSLKVILTRAARKNLIVQKAGKCSLTDAGRGRAQKLASEADVRRRVNELLDDARNFISEQHGGALTPDETNRLFLTLIVDTIENLEQFLGHDANTSSVEGIVGLEEKPLAAAFLDYIKEAERARPAAFATLQEIISGSMMSLALHREGLTEITRRFSTTSVFLDSNFVFSVLELSADEFCKPCQELLGLMRAEGSFQLRIFDFTVDEIIRVLRAYERQKLLYPDHIKIGSIYASMKAKGWTPSRVREFIGCIESTLEERGICIHRTGLDIRDYRPSDARWESLIEVYKPEKGAAAQMHDLAAIEQVRKLRQVSARHIQEAKAFFLTSDLKLARFNFGEFGHRDRSTVAEVIPDRLLTTLLWLKNPKAGEHIPLHSIIAMHSSRLFIDESVWEKFCASLDDLRKGGSVQASDVALLFYDRHLPDVLRACDAGDLDRLNPQLILDEIAAAKKRVDESQSDKMTEQQALFEQRLRNLLEEQAAQHGQEKAALQEQLTEIGRLRDEKRQALRLSAERAARWCVFVGSIVAVLGLAAFGYTVLPLVARQWDQIEPYSYVIEKVGGVCLGAIGLTNPGHLKDRVRERLASWIYRRRSSVLPEFELELHKAGGLVTEHASG